MIFRAADLEFDFGLLMPGAGFAVGDLVVFQPGAERAPRFVLQHRPADTVHVNFKGWAEAHLGEGSLDAFQGLGLPGGTPDRHRRQPVHDLVSAFGEVALGVLCRDLVLGSLADVRVEAEDAKLKFTLPG